MHVLPLHSYLYNHFLRLKNTYLTQSGFSFSLKSNNPVKFILHNKPIETQINKKQTCWLTFIIIYKIVTNLNDKVLRYRFDN